MGAGKLVLATVEDVAATLATAVPESAVVALPRGEGDDIDPRAEAVLRDLAWASRGPATPRRGSWAACWPAVLAELSG